MKDICYLLEDEQRIVQLATAFALVIARRCEPKKKPPRLGRVS